MTSLVCTGRFQSLTIYRGLWPLAVGLAVAAAIAASLPVPTFGQVFRRSGVYPNEDYFRSFPDYYEGDFEQAAEGFRQAGRSAVRSSEGRWIDSICCHAMLGECFYRMGGLAQALQQYDTALRLYLAYADWMLNLEFPEILGPSSNVAGRPYTWGVSKRSAMVAQIPERMGIFQGRISNEDVVRRGGVVAPAELHRLSAGEVVRCTALAIRRRREILGPSCPHAILTAQLLEVLARRPTRPNHWSQRWIEAQLGLAYAAAGRPAEAVEELEKSLLIGGQYNHTLTAIALLELGQLALEKEQYQAAASYFFEATFAAAPFQQFDLMEEAFYKGLVVHLVSGQRGVYPPLVPAAAWAHRNSRLLEVSLLLSTAENQAAFGEAAAAQSLLDQSRRMLLRSEMLAGAIGARLHYQTAVVQYQLGNLPAGTKALAFVLAYQRKASRRLFQIALADETYTSGRERWSDRVADLVYEETLREPTAKDWVHDPMETLTVALTSQAGPMSRWFEIALLKRKEYEKALEISDRVRRSRFFSTLPLGGRLLALRWILEAPQGALSEKAVLQRRDLLARRPAYAELSRKSAALRAALEREPLAPGDEQAAKRQVAGFAELAKVSQAQEVLLHDIALRREPSEFVFPPLLDFKKLQQQLPDRRLLAAYFTTGQNFYVFGLRRGHYGYQRMAAPQQLRGEVASLLRTMGNFDRNQPVRLKDLLDEAWKKPSQKLLERLMPGMSPGLWDQCDELIVIPDGVLWYIPFESLQIPSGDSTQPLISKVAIRVAPTVSLAMPDRRGPRPTAQTAVVVGRLFPRDDEKMVEAAFAQLQAALPGATRLPPQLPAPSGAFAAVCPRLVVLSDLEDSDQGPYQWSPIPIDRGKPGSTLEHWFPLPWGGPEQVLLPGFHTAAEGSLKRGGAGDELFLTCCGLMANGARTVLLSRWRTGGQTSYDLMREFAQELPHAAAAECWRRSVQLAMNAEIDPEKEPRVDALEAAEGVKAVHPFFWSGYLLVDTGATPNVTPPPEPGAKAPPEPKAPPEAKAPPAKKP